MMVKEPKSDLKLSDPFTVATMLDEYKNAAQECFIVVTLNTRNQCIDTHVVTVGIVDASLVHPREVFRCAIADGAAAIIVAHNHPSGDPTPSSEDLAITRNLIEAGKIIDIPVFDHIIIGRPHYTSLRETGTLAFG